MNLVRARPMYVIGDSQAVVYDDRIAWPPTGTPWVMRAAYCALYAGRLADERGALDPAFVTALRGLGLVLPLGEAVAAIHTGTQPHAVAMLQAGDRTADDWPLVLACGHLDLAQIARDFPHDDFELPDGIERRFAVPQACRRSDPGAAPALEIMTLVHTRLMGLRYGLHALRRMGFARVAVLSLPPPTADDAAFARLAEHAVLPATPPRLAARWRYKLVLAMNDALRLICAEDGTDFVDRWADQTDRGLARDGVLRDALHPTDAAADATVAALVRLTAATAARGMETAP